MNRQKPEAEPYTVKRTFTGRISSEELIRRIIQAHIRSADAAAREVDGGEPHS